MYVGVTSTNPLKLAAVKRAYQTIGLLPTLTGYVTHSRVGEQPIGDLTLKGARNRLNSILEIPSSLDAIISIENGIYLEHDTWIDRAVLLHVDTHTRKEHIGYSQGVQFPTACVIKAQTMGFAHITVGRIMYLESLIKNPQDPHFELSGKSREEYLYEALVALLQEVYSKDKKE